MKRVFSIAPVFALIACGGGDADEEAVLDMAADLNSQVQGEGSGEGLVMGFEVYPDSEVQVNMSGGGTSMVLFETPDSTEEVLGHYREAAEQRGFELSDYEARSNQKGIRGDNPDGASFSLQVTDEGDRRIGDMSIREAG